MARVWFLPAASQSGVDAFEPFSVTFPTGTSGSPWINLRFSPQYDQAVLGQIVMEQEELVDQLPEPATKKPRLNVNNVTLNIAHTPLPEEQAFTQAKQHHFEKIYKLRTSLSAAQTQRQQDEVNMSDDDMVGIAAEIRYLKQELAKVLCQTQVQYEKKTETFRVRLVNNSLVDMIQPIPAKLLLCLQATPEPSQTTTTTTPDFKAEDENLFHSAWCSQPIQTAFIPNSQSDMTVGYKAGNPSFVATDATGERLYVALSCPARVSVLHSQTGEQLLKWKLRTGSVYTAGIAVQDEFVFVGNEQFDLVEVYHVDGTFAYDFSCKKHFRSLANLMVYRDLVYVCTGDHRVIVCDLQGNFQFSWGSTGSLPGMFQHPTSISFDQINDCIFVADSDNRRIQAFTRSGHFKAEIRGDASNAPFESVSHICVQDNVVYAQDDKQKMMHMFCAETLTHLSDWPLAVSTHPDYYPGGFCLAPSGNYIWMCNPGKHRIERFCRVRN